MNTSSSAYLAHGQTLQRQGRLAEAAALFRQVLSGEPRNADALHLLGITLGRMGRPEEAVELITAATRLRPSNPVMHANLGNALAEVGRDAEAIKSYERAAKLKPDLVPAHRGRGVVLAKLNRLEASLDSLRRAVGLAPGEAQLHSDLGVTLERLGRRNEALGHLERAVALNPYHVQAHYNRAVVQFDLGRYEQALSSIEQAVQLEPRNAVMLVHRGNTLWALGRAEEALASLDSSLAIAPQQAGVHHQRALILLVLQRHEHALASLDQALALAPERFGPHFHRGVALMALERQAEAIVSFDRALALEPTSAESFNNRGVALQELNRPHDALESFAAAANRKPDYVEAHTNLGNTLKGVGRFHEALESFDRALAIAPSHAPTLWGKSLLKLTQGELEEGWPLYEARLQVDHLRPYQRDFMIPRWLGEPLEGKTLLVHAEQGLGDTLQFIRYVPLLEARGAHVVLEVPPALLELLRSFAMRGTLVGQGEPSPQADYHCPLLSLPLAFQTRLDSIPGGVPYVTAEQTAVQEWRERLSSLPGFKIGLNWQGHVGAEKQPWVRGRSFALACAEPLASVPGVHLVSLQKGVAAEQRTQVGFGPAIEQLTDPMDTGPEALQETAALMSALDLVITSDTSTAHLAGALGVQTWVVLHAIADWRWLLDRSDSPWYPTMRLVRQRTAGDWPEVFGRLARELAVRTHGADPTAPESRSLPD